MRNVIRVERAIDGFTVKALATYCPSVDAWEVRIESHFGEVAIYSPAEVGGDAWDMIQSGIESALIDDRARHADVTRWEIAARAAGWTHGGDCGGFIYDGSEFDSWKAAASADSATTYDLWRECCEDQDIAP